MTRTLILIPTQSERVILQPQLQTAMKPDDRVELCGFGLVAAAAHASQLIADTQPEQVVLAGIAGTFCDEFPVGQAAAFDDVACYGIGAASGSEHQTAGDLGWDHFRGPRSSTAACEIIIRDTISLGRIAALKRHPRSGLLLSVAAAAGGPDDAQRHRQRYPDAVAEDMEGFAVALACELAGIPLEIIRGISNPVGDRDVTNWQIKPALEAAAALIRGFLRA